MKQIELTSKLVLAIIGLASVSAILIPTYAVPTIRSADIFDGEVKTADLANGAVTNSKIANDAVTTAKIKNGEVTTADIKDATIQSEDIASGVIPSSSGIGQIDTQVEQETVSFPLGQTFNQASIFCDSGYIASGGGYVGANSIIAYSDGPLFGPGSSIINGWTVEAENTNPSEAAEMTVSVICLKIVP